VKGVVVKEKEERKKRKKERTKDSIYFLQIHH
jgi:hypothetical protein